MDILVKARLNNLLKTLLLGMLGMLIYFFGGRLQQWSSAIVVVATVTIGLRQHAHATGVSAAFAPTPLFIGITVFQQAGGTCDCSCHGYRR